MSATTEPRIARLRFPGLTEIKISLDKQLPIAVQRADRVKFNLNGADILVPVLTYRESQLFELNDLAGAIALAGEEWTKYQEQRAEYDAELAARREAEIGEEPI